MFLACVCARARACAYLKIYFYNFLRSFNICNITIHDVNIAKDTEEFPNAKAIISTKYKTAMLYGKWYWQMPSSNYWSYILQS